MNINNVLLAGIGVSTILMSSAAHARPVVVRHHDNRHGHGHGRVVVRRPVVVHRPVVVVRPPVVIRTPVVQADPLSYQRYNIQTSSYRLSEAARQLYSLARRYNMRYAVQSTYQLNLAASNLATYEARLQNCGPYEARRGLCTRSISQEVMLFNQMRNALHQVRPLGNVGRHLLRSIHAQARYLENIFASAGLVRRTNYGYVQQGQPVMPQQGVATRMVPETPMARTQAAPETVDESGVAVDGYNPDDLAPAEAQ